MSTRARVNPKIIEWALRRADKSNDFLASKLSVKQEKVVEWVDGTTCPTFKQAEAIANGLRIPFGYLFLSRPPEQELTLPDFRRHPDGSPVDPSPDCVDAVNDVQLKHDWFRDNQLEIGGDSVSFVGSATRNDETEALASHIRQSLGLDEQTQTSASGPDELLTKLVRNAESIGFLVMRSGTVGSNTHRPLSMKEFRGFAISDELAPTVFINSSDSKTGQLFTLVHELAHLWLGSSGISPSAANPPSATQNDTNRLEWFCNQVAASVLLPRAIYHRLWTERTEDHADRARRIAKRLRVSYLAALIRAAELDLIRARESRHLIDEEKERIEQTPPAKRAPGGDFYAAFFAKNSERFTFALLEATKEGRVFYQEAANLLGIRVPTIDKLVERVLER